MDWVIEIGLIKKSKTQRQILIVRVLDMVNQIWNSSVSVRCRGWVHPPK